MPCQVIPFAGFRHAGRTGRALVPPLGFTPFDVFEKVGSFESAFRLAHKQDHSPAILRAYGVPLHLHEAVNFRLQIPGFDGPDFAVAFAAFDEIDLSRLHGFAVNTEFLPELVQRRNPVQTLPAYVAG